MLRRICTILKKDHRHSLLQPAARFSSTTNNGAADSSRRGVVMSFGDGNHGALGLPPSLTGIGADVYEPTLIPGLPSDITAVAAGHYHSLAVSSRGDLWAWGRNEEAQLGRGVLVPRDTWHEPKRVESLDHVHVTAAFASGVVSSAIGDDGSLWVWGKSKRGQLGLGPGITEAQVPSRVAKLAGQNIAKVDAKADGRIGKMGGFVEASVLDSAAANSKGGDQFEAAERRVLEGMAKEKDMPIVWEPCLVEELDGTQVIDIASGLGHSLAICNASSILSWGWNRSSQLGRTGDANLPSEVEGMSEERAVSVSAGRVHSLAVTSEGQLWVWGCGKNGRLGLGSPYDEQEPIMVVDSFEGCKVLQAVAGFDHNLVLELRFGAIYKSSSMETTGRAVGFSSFPSYFANNSKTSISSSSCSLVINPNAKVMRSFVQMMVGKLVALRTTITCCSAVQESSSTATSTEEEKPKPKPKPAAKAAAKPLPQLMEEEVLPLLKSTLEVQADISELQLSFQDNTLEGSRGFSLSSYGQGASTVEPFLIDEKKITAKHVVFWVEKRLAAQGIIPVWIE
ncbi:Probable E3 ubiquitin-protein ligase HERC2 [Linum grandiflorum]